MSFSLFKKAPSLSFVFDIRDTSVSIAVARFEIEKKPEIILCQNFELKQQDSNNHKKYLSSMIRTIDKAIISARRGLIKIGNKEDIGKYYFFVGSPWSVSQTKTIKIIKDKPFEINNRVLEKIIVGEEFALEKSIEEQTLEPNWKVLEEKIIQSKLNGYKIDDIFGKKTSNLAIELFVSFIPYEIKDKMSSYMDKRIGKNIKRQNNSCILSSYSFFRDLYSNKNDFIYVDVGKLITDVYVVRDDVIFGIVSYPFGEEKIIQISQSKTNLPRDIFMSHLSVGQDKKFDLTSHNNGEDLLKSGFNLWKSKLKDSLSKICTEMNIPNNMFILTNSLISSILAKELSAVDNNKRFEILNSPIEVSAIGEGVLNNFILNGKAFANEPYIKMDLVFLDKIFKQQ
ncbi:MAG: hypothetical protein WC933_02360 [Candidatus Paceibacterota bacterium]|jgi:hypothetical protein